MTSQNDIEADADSRKGPPIDWRAFRNKALTVETACAKLKERETSTTISNATAPGWTVRIDTNQVPTMCPMEDALAHGTISVQPDREWMYWAVFDGHSGWENAKILSNNLADYVGRELRGLSVSQIEDPECLGSTIKSAFVALDSEILDDGLRAFEQDIFMAEELCKTGPVISGTCALLALMDPVSLTMHVACLGDCRAVLGRRPATPGKEWETIPLSEDHTGFNEAEKERIALDHPGETPINPVNGRLLGMAVTRSFGDARFKWPADKVETLEQRCFAKPKVENYLTPPYMIAEPTLQSIKIQPGDVLILGSDGFWDHLSNEDGVLCASMWTETNDKRNSSDTPIRRGEDPIEHDMEFGRSEDGYPYRWTLSEAAYTVEDDNLATHMIKNAFGGRVKDLFVAVMSVEPPYSYEIRDDATVMTVQFQED